MFSSNPMSKVIWAVICLGLGGVLAACTPVETFPLNTPSPEGLVVGELVEISMSEDHLPYTYREDYIDKDGVLVTRVFVQYQGEEIRLGDDYGRSNAEAANEKHLVWTYQERRLDTGYPLKSGLYVYEVETGESTRFADGRKVGFSELDSDWVVYISWENALPRDLPANDLPGDIRPLFAYNIVSGKTITLTASLPVIEGRMTQSFYGVSNNRAGWMEYDMQTQQYSIKISELNTGQIQTLDIPGLQHPRYFSISEDLAVWRDTNWRGYSLAHNISFPIPYAPPGVEDTIWVIVTAKNSALEWEIDMGDETRRYFSAPVIIK